MIIFEWYEWYAFLAISFSLTTTFTLFGKAMKEVMPFGDSKLQNTVAYITWFLLSLITFPFLVAALMLVGFDEFYFHLCNGLEEDIEED